MNFNIRTQEISKGFYETVWSALLGKDKIFNNSNSQQLLHKIISSIQNKGIKRQLPNDITEIIHSSEFIILKAFRLTNQTLTTFPTLCTSVILPIVTFKIKEWNLTSDIAGQIEGNVKNALPISFFATDYLENRNIYTSQQNLNIKIVAFAYTALKPLVEEGLSEDFVDMQLNEEYGEHSVYDYLGIILGIEKIDDTNLGFRTQGYFLKIRLVKIKNDEDFFAINMFIAKDNLDLENISVGDRISGVMSLQGCIA